MTNKPVVAEKPLYVCKLTDEDYLTFFARPYKPPADWAPFVMPDQEEEKGEGATENFFHDFPAKDQANKFTLLKGANEVETIRLNNRASILLADIRNWARTIQRNESYSKLHNASGVESDDDEPCGTGYGMDMRHDDGPSVLHYNKKTKTWRSGLKEKYEAGSPEKAKFGEPWIPGRPIVMRIKKLDSGVEVKYLHRIGSLIFKYGEGNSALTKAGRRWRKYETIATVPHGKQYEEPIATQGLIGGSTSADVSCDSDSDDGPTNRGTASSFDAASVWIASENEIVRAHAQLDRIAASLTPRMYDAVIAAAEGDTFDEIGRMFMPGQSSNSKGPGYMGRTLVVDALELLILKEFREAE